MRTVADYLALLPSANAQQPKFTAMLAGVLQPFEEIQAMFAQVPGAYDVDTAIGKQLDTVGQWVGISRNLTVPITGTYFTYDTTGVGLDQGVWYQPGDSTQGVLSLDDDTYRLVIKMKIAANYWDGTLQGTEAIFAPLLAVGITAYMVDNFDMSVTIKVSGAGSGSPIVAVLQQAYTWMRPAGVSLTGVVLV
jgi:hypothetical protein